MTAAYEAISAFYGERRARRSGVRLMNHIDEGLKILDELGAIRWTKEAFCLHPLFQVDAELTTVGESALVNYSLNTFSVMLTMEYRHWANAWLSHKVDDFGNIDGLPSPGPLPEVRDMLIADKVQNYKDFLAYHAQTHARSFALDCYFKQWLEVLGIDTQRFTELCAKL